ncbi:hypothetical protein D3C85_1291980 [compost metagenome]
MPGDKKNADDWPAEAKFAAVLHAATLSEIRTKTAATLVLRKKMNAFWGNDSEDV